MKIVILEECTNEDDLTIMLEHIVHQLKSGLDRSDSPNWYIDRSDSLNVDLESEIAQILVRLEHDLVDDAMCMASMLVSPEKKVVARTAFDEEFGGGKRKHVETVDYRGYCIDVFAEPRKNDPTRVDHFCRVVHSDTNKTISGFDPAEAPYQTNGHALPENAILEAQQLIDTPDELTPFSGTT